MDAAKNLYRTAVNPLLIQSPRPLPDKVAVIGAGTIGPDIGYYLKSAIPIGYSGFGDIACTDAAKEGIAAFLEKRPAKFTK